MSNHILLLTKVLTPSQQNRNHLTHLLQTDYSCFVDASSTSQQQKSGIAWILRNLDNLIIMEGSTPASTSLEAKAIALREAVNFYRNCKVSRKTILSHDTPADSLARDARTDLKTYVIS